MTLPRRANLGRPERLRLRLGDELALVPERQSFTAIFADDFTRADPTFQGGFGTAWAVFPGALVNSMAYLGVGYGTVSARSSGGNLAAVAPAGLTEVVNHFVQGDLLVDSGQWGLFACAGPNGMLLIDGGRTGHFRLRNADYSFNLEYSTGGTTSVRFWRDNDGLGNLATQINGEWSTFAAGIVLPAAMASGTSGGLWATGGGSSMGTPYIDNFVYGAS